MDAYVPVEWMSMDGNDDRAPDFSAVRANARLELHEAVCAERYKAILSEMIAVHTRLTAVSNRMWATASAVILMCVTGIAGLVVLIITRGLK